MFNIGPSNQLLKRQGISGTIPARLGQPTKQPINQPINNKPMIGTSPGILPGLGPTNPPIGIAPGMNPMPSIGKNPHPLLPPDTPQNNMSYAGGSPTFDERVRMPIDMSNSGLMNNVQPGGMRFGGMPMNIGPQVPLWQRYLGMNR